MEPFSAAIGVVASVAGLAQVTATCLYTLYRCVKVVKNAERDVKRLVSQLRNLHRVLCYLKTRLLKVQVSGPWLSSELEDIWSSVLEETGESLQELQEALNRSKRLLDKATTSSRLKLRVRELLRQDVSSFDSAKLGNAIYSLSLLQVIALGEQLDAWSSLESQATLTAHTLNETSQIHQLAKTLNRSEGSDGDQYMSKVSLASLSPELQAEKRSLAAGTRRKPYRTKHSKCQRIRTRRINMMFGTLELETESHARMDDESDCSREKSMFDPANDLLQIKFRATGPGWMSAFALHGQITFRDANELLNPFPSLSLRPVRTIPLKLVHPILTTANAFAFKRLLQSGEVHPKDYIYYYDGTTKSLESAFSTRYFAARHQHWDAYLDIYKALCDANADPDATSPSFSRVLVMAQNPQCESNAEANLKSFWSELARLRVRNGGSVQRFDLFHALQNPELKDQDFLLSTLFGGNSTWMVEDLEPEDFCAIGSLGRVDAQFRKCLQRYLSQFSSRSLEAPESHQTDLVEKCFPLSCVMGLVEAQIPRQNSSHYGILQTVCEAGFDHVLSLFLGNLRGRSEFQYALSRLRGLSLALRNFGTARLLQNEVEPSVLALTEYLTDPRRHDRYSAYTAAEIEEVRRNVRIEIKELQQAGIHCLWHRQDINDDALIWAIIRAPFTADLLIWGNIFSYSRMKPQKAEEISESYLWLAILRGYPELVRLFLDYFSSSRHHEERVGQLDTQALESTELSADSAWAILTLAAELGRWKCMELLLQREPFSSYVRHGGHDLIYFVEAQLVKVSKTRTFSYRYHRELELNEVYVNGLCAAAAMEALEKTRAIVEQSLTATSILHSRQDLTAPSGCNDSKVAVGLYNQQSCTILPELLNCRPSTAVIGTIERLKRDWAYLCARSRTVSHYRECFTYYMYQTKKVLTAPMRSETYIYGCFFVLLYIAWFAIEAFRVLVWIAHLPRPPKSFYCLLLLPVGLACLLSWR